MGSLAGSLYLDWLWLRGICCLPWSWHRWLIFFCCWTDVAVHLPLPVDIQAMSKKLPAPIPWIALRPPEAAVALSVGPDFFDVKVTAELRVLVFWRWQGPNRGLSAKCSALRRSSSARRTNSARTGKREAGATLREIAEAADLHWSTVADALRKR